LPLDIACQQKLVPAERQLKNQRVVVMRDASDGAVA
jgi:hypothetical protein